MKEEKKGRESEEIKSEEMWSAIKKLEKHRSIFRNILNWYFDEQISNNHVDGVLIFPAADSDYKYFSNDTSLLFCDSILLQVNVDILEVRHFFQ